MEGLDHNTIELVGAFLTGVVGPIAYYIIGKIILKRKDRNRDIVKESIEQSSVIDEELARLRDLLEVDRVWIAKFHNGGVFYPTGRSIQKFSIFYEATSSGISKTAHSLNNIPCSLYSKALKKLSKREALLIPTFERKTQEETYGIKSLRDITGSLSTYIVPLFSLDDKFIGMLGIDNIKGEKLLNDGELSEFNEASARIAGYLSTFLENDRYV